MSHFHYDRFETPDDERDGKWSVYFQTNPQGEIDKVLTPLDEAEVTFTRRIPADLSAPATLQAYVGAYETTAGVLVHLILKEDGTFGIQGPGGNFWALLPWKPRQFRIKEISSAKRSKAENASPDGVCADLTSTSTRSVPFSTIRSISRPLRSR